MWKTKNFDTEDVVKSSHGILQLRLVSFLSPVLPGVYQPSLIVVLAAVVEKEVHGTPIAASK